MSDFPPMEEHISTEIQSQPNSRDAEEAVLGAVLIYPESYYEIAQILHAEDFYVIRNQWLWDSFTRLHDRRVPIDILTVSEDLEERNQLNEIGGQAYLVALVNQTPTALHAEAYAKIVEQNSVRRRMLASANELAKLAYDQEKPLDTIIDEAEKSIFGLNPSQASSPPSSSRPSVFTEATANTSASISIRSISSTVSRIPQRGARMSARIAPREYGIAHSRCGVTYDRVTVLYCSFAEV